MAHIATMNGPVEMSPEAEAEFEASRRPSFEQLCANLRARIHAARAAAIYADIVIPFPVAERAVQFRNDQDRANLSDKVTGAIAMVLAGNGQVEMTYVCADNSVAAMTAEQFIVAGQAVLAAKDAIFYQFKAVKDLLDAAEDAEDLAAVEAEILSLATSFEL